MSVNNRIAKMVDDDTSFALLRANPKLTGNVKVIVDSDSNMYLDTFKVSLSLSQYKYRHIPINPSEYYGRTLMSKMKDITSDEFYKVEDTCYNLFAMADDYDGQYYDKYNYGVRTNFDRLYNENFALLAPLCIRKTLPDFFLVFKFNDYSSFHNYEKKELLNYDNVTLVKSYDMREGTNLGTYIRNIVNNNRKFVGDIYTGYSYDHFNGYNGISVDRGVVSCVYESTVDERMFNNQVAMNNWYTLGFERNHMVSKDIVNFEFMFSDETENIFSTPTYFGIYIRLNGESQNFSCIGYSGTINEFNINPSDYDDPFNPSSVDNRNIIYGISTPEKFIRLTDNVKTSQEVRKYCRKESAGLIVTDIIDSNKIVEGYNTLHYVSFIMNQPATPGEHYKIIDNYTHSIYEVVIRGGNYDNDLSETYTIPFTYNDNEYKIYRIFINNIEKIDENNPEKKRIIREQSELIARAFNIFITNGTDNMDAYSDEDGTVSILYGNHPLDQDPPIFIWTCAPDNSSYDPVRIFGLENNRDETFPKIEISENDNINKLYFPIGYEYMGRRVVYGVYFHNITEFVSTSGNLYPYLVKSSITNQVLTHGSILYSVKTKRSSGEYYDEYYVFNNSSYVKTKVLKQNDDGSITSFERTDPCIIGFGPIRSYYVNLNHEMKYNSRLQIFENTPLNAGVCSIFNIKDFYHDVLDQDSMFVVKLDSDNPDDAYAEICPGNKTGGEYYTTNSEDEPFTRGTAITQYQEESLHNYIDMYDTFDIATDGGDRFLLNSKDALGEYITSLQNNAHYNLDISLIEPYCCKWRSLSTDNYGMRLRVMQSLKDVNYKTLAIKPYLIDDASSYFIPGDNDDGIGFIGGQESSSYKFVDNKYSPENIIHNNLITVDSNLYSELNPYNKFSKVYMYGNNEIEFVSAGIKLRIYSNNSSIINLSNYVGYSAILVNYPTSYNKFTIFIDELTEQIEVIMYMCGDYLKEIKSKKENVEAIIKKRNGDAPQTITYAQGIRLDIIDPYEISREDTKYVETTKGSVHPSYCTPVMVDMFEFESIYTEINNKFKKVYDDFNYTNLRLSDIKNINQTWMQKVPDINNSIQQSTGVEKISYTYITSHRYSATQGDKQGTTPINLINSSSVIYYASGAELGSKRVEVKITQSNIEYNSNYQNPIYQLDGKNYDDYNAFSRGFIWQSERHIIKDSYVMDGYNQMGTAIYNFSIKPGAFHNQLDNKTNTEISTGEIFYKRINCLTISNVYVHTEVPDAEELINVGQTIHLFYTTSIPSSGYITIFKKIGDFVVGEKEEVGERYYKLKIMGNHTITFSENPYFIFGLKDSTPPRGIYPSGPDGVPYGIGSKEDFVNIRVSDYHKEDGIDKDHFFEVTHQDGGQTRVPIYAELTIDLVTPQKYIKDPSGLIYNKPDGGNEILEYHITDEKTETETRVTTINNFTATTALTLYQGSDGNGMDITKSYWDQQMCRLFTKFDTYNADYGYVSGYEKNCYIASRGITRYDPYNNNSNIIILNNWNGAVITENITRNVKLEITSALFRKIKNYPAFIASWSHVESDYKDSYMDKYIENAIMNNIRINDKNTFKLYANTNSKNFEFLTEKPNDPEELKLYTEVKNLNNVLTYENNRYYMTIYSLKAYSYYAEFYIEL